MDFKEFEDFRLQDLHDVSATVLKEELRPVEMDNLSEGRLDIGSPAFDEMVNNSESSSDKGKMLLYDHKNFSENKKMLSRIES